MCGGGEGGGVKYSPLGEKIAIARLRGRAGRDSFNEIASCEPAIHVQQSRNACFTSKKSACGRLARHKKVTVFKNAVLLFVVLRLRHA